MFSGIVESLGEVLEFNPTKAPARLVLKTKIEFDTNDLKIGDSVCVSGVCLTVVRREPGLLAFDLVAETVRCSIFQAIGAGSRVNLERSLKVGDRLNGHFVFGHVDSVTRLTAREDDQNCLKLVFELPKALRAYIVPKGSISISGVSLTVGEVSPERFCVYIIPHTAEVTTLGALQAEDLVNLEIDMLARYVLRENAAA